MRDDELDFTIARLGESDAVHRIHESGGSILGSSRGHQDPGEMVARLQELGVGVLFAIGGDGTLRGAQKIGEEAARRGVTLGVIGVPRRSTTTSRSCGAPSASRRPSPKPGTRPMRPTPRLKRRATGSDW